MYLPLPARRILGISLESGGIRFLLVRLSGGRPLVEHAEWHACADVDGWAVAPPEQYLRLAAFIAEKKAAMGAGNEKVRVALPSGAVFFRQWSFPFRSRSKIRKAVHLLLETELPFSPDDIAVRLCSAGKRGGEHVVLAVCMLARRLEAWNDAMERHGVEQELLTVHPFSLQPVLPAAADAEYESGSGTGPGLGKKIQEKLAARTASAKAAAEAGERIIALCFPDTVTFSLVQDSSIRAVWDCERNSVRDITSKSGLESAFPFVTNGTIDFRKPVVAFGEQRHCPGMTACADKDVGVPYEEPSESDMAPAVRALFLQLGASGSGENGPGAWWPALGLVCAGMVSLFGRSFFLPVLPGILRGRIPDFHSRTQGSEAGKARYFPRQGVRLAAWLLALTLAWGFSLYAGTARMAEESRELDEKMRLAFHNAVPGVTARLGSTQMLSVLNEHIASLEQSDSPDEGQSGVLDLFRSVHELTPPELGIVLTSVSIDAQRVMLSGQAADFSEVDRFREVLSAVPGITNVRILSAVSGKRSLEQVAFEMDCTRSGIR